MEQKLLTIATVIGGGIGYVISSKADIGFGIGFGAVLSFAIGALILTASKMLR